MAVLNVQSDDGDTKAHCVHVHRFGDIKMTDFVKMDNYSTHICDESLHKRNRAFRNIATNFPFRFGKLFISI